MLTLGIDEAGRGPVIGPLVLAGALVDEETAERFRKMGVKDSKLLSARRREELFGSITALARKHAIIVVQAQEVDEALASDTLNLNWLEAHKSAEIINKLRPERVVIDSPGNNVAAYKKYLVKLLSVQPKEILVEHKADVNHVECAAASVLAKVTRDREIEKIKKLVGTDFGSGYPADPRTRAFLEANLTRYPDIFRKSWAPYKDGMSKKKQQTLRQYGGAT